MHAAILQSDTGALSQAQRFDLLMDTVSENSFDLLVCPELFMSGYNAGDHLKRCAESVDGPFFQKVATLARETSTAIVYGYPEINGDRLFNAAICVNAEGECIANHRKLLIPPGFEQDYFTCGQRYTIFDLIGMRCALLVCYDAEFPESVRAAALAGAQLVIVPTALGEQWPSVAHQLMPTRSFENGIWLMYANHAGAENGLRYLGASCIVEPNGKDAARAGSDQQLISAEIDTASVATAQKRLPYLVDRRRLEGIS